MNVGVTVGIGIDVNFPDNETVKEVSEVLLVTVERVGEAELERVILDDTVELGLCVEVLVNWIEEETVAVWNLGVWDNFGEDVVVGQLVEVLVGLELVVPFGVAVDVRVTLVLADLVRVPNPLADTVGVAVFVLEGNIVLDMEEDPDDVLVEVTVLVWVFVIRGVNVPLGECEAEAEAVGVLEERTDNVWVDEAVDVLEEGAERVYEGVAELVFDLRADPVVVLETVIVLVEVDEPVTVFVMIDEVETIGLEEGDLEANVERVEVLVEVIVLVDMAERVNKRVGSEEIVDIAVFVDVLEAIEERVGRA